MPIYNGKTAGTTNTVEFGRRLGRALGITPSERPFPVRIFIASFERGRTTTSAAAAGAAATAELYMRRILGGGIDFKTATRALGRARAEETLPTRARLSQNGEPALAATTLPYFEITSQQLVRRVSLFFVPRTTCIHTRARIFLHA